MFIVDLCHRFQFQDTERKRIPQHAMELALKFAGADFSFRQKLCMAVAAAGSIHKRTHLLSPVFLFSNDT